MGISTLGLTQQTTTLPTTTGSGISNLGKAIPVKSKTDLKSIEGLRATAEQAGYGKEVSEIIDAKPKLSLLQRVSKGLGALNPAESILTGVEQESVVAGVGKYATGIVKGVGSALTGKDYEGERRYFSDVAEKLGVENGIAKFGIGFVGDVLLDPSSYFGGAIAKGVLATTKGIGKVALKGVAKVAPEVEAGLRMTGTGLQDALGRAFAYGYKSSEGAKESVLTFLSKSQRAKLGLASSNLQRLGTGTLSKSQSEELALKMIAGRRAEFDLGTSVSKDAMKTVNDLFPDIKVKNPQHAQSILDNLEQTTQKNVADIRTKVDEIVKPYFAGRQKIIKSGTRLENKIGLQETPALGSFKRVDELNNTVDALKLQLSELRKARGSIGGVEKTINDLGGAITKEESVRVHNSLIKYEEERLAQAIDDIASKIENFKNKPKILTGAKTKLTQMTPEEVLVFGERRILQLQNELADKSRLLTTATQGRVTGSKLIAEARATGDYSKIAKLDSKLADAVKLNSEDPIVQKSIDELLARSKKIAETSGVENPYEIYFPFIKSDKLQKFLNESQGIKVGSEGYRKQFKNLLTNENMELNPAKAFFTRESQIVSDRITRDFLGGFVKNYGKGLDEFKSVDDALKNGYTLIREKGIFGKELGYVNKFDGALIRDSISPEFQTVSMLAKATGFDSITSLFKRSVTGLFAPFHVRNFTSGMIQNFEVLGVDVFNPKNIAVGQKIAYLMGKGAKMPAGTITLGGKTTKFKDVMKPFVDRFSGDTFYNADFDFALKSGSELKSVSGLFSKTRVGETIKTVGFGQEAIPFKIGRAIGQFIEHQQKATAYVTALGQGKNIPEALKLAEAAGFDYRALTRFESQIMRRLIPFYSFTRKNIELQLKTLGENPQRINQVLRFFEGASEIGGKLTDEEKQGLPEYLKEQILISFGKNALGQPIVAGGFGIPIEQPGQAVFGKSMSESIRKISAMLNPIIKTPLEKAFGKDFFMDREIKDIYDAKAYNILPQFIKDFIDFQEIEKDVFTKNSDGKLIKTGTKIQYQADPEKLHILRNLPTSRLFSYLYEIMREDTEPTAKTFNVTTGVKPKPIDLETVKYFRDRDKRRELEDLLIISGVVKKFEQTYIPKK